MQKITKHLFSILILYLIISINTFSQQTDNSTDKIKVARFEFEREEFDFGKIESGEKISYVYKFKNIGEVPLIITDAKGSCSCAKPFYPKDPIWPEETSEIEVVFDTKGKKGMQSKRITIYANTDSIYTYVTMKGEISDFEKKISPEIIEKIDKTIEVLNQNCFAIYPNLLNKTLQLELKEYIGKVASIEIYNKIGNKIMDKEIERVSRESTLLDISSFSSGTYIITIFIDGEEPLTQCFVVTNK